MTTPIEALQRQIDELNTRIRLLEAAERPNQATDTASSPTFAGLTDTGGLNVGTATGATAGVIFAEVTDAGTATQTLPIRVAHRSSGTPAAGFGNDVNWRADSSTNTLRSQGDVVSQWVVATDATRTARLSLFVDDSAASREFLRGQGSGTAALIGFLGAAAQGVFASGGAAPAGGVGTAAGGWDTAAHRDSAITLLNNIRTCLVNLGLMS